MTLNEFQDWIDQNPQNWAKVADPLWNRSEQQELAQVNLPPVYRRFLEKIGPIALSNSSLILIGIREITAVSSFMKGLNQPNEGIFFDYLIPFCDRTANQWYFCFDEQQIVEFDPLDPFSVENVVAPTFEHFLEYVLKTTP